MTEPCVSYVKAVEAFRRVRAGLLLAGLMAICGVAASASGTELTAGASSMGGAHDIYVRSIRTHRAIIEETFRDPRLSPLLANDRRLFQGLRYFPIDPGQRLTAQFRAARSKEAFRLPATNQRFFDYAKLGTLTFPAPGGGKASLTLYQRADLGASGRLTALAPFRDLTNGDTTYAGGRYLKFFLPLPETPVVDFNRAVNPYCAYDATIACPIPPAENRLAYPVPAGEMIFQGATLIEGSQGKTGRREGTDRMEGEERL